MEKFLQNHLPQLRLVRPEALYLAWLDCRALSDDSHQLQRTFFEEAGVYLEAGNTYGPQGEGFLRMTIACPRPLLSEALQRMARALSIT